MENMKIIRVYKDLGPVEKYNPYHGPDGRFASANGMAAGGSFALPKNSKNLKNATIPEGVRVFSGQGAKGKRAVTTSIGVTIEGGKVTGGASKLETPQGDKGKVLTLENTPYSKKTVDAINERLAKDPEMQNIFKHLENDLQVGDANLDKNQTPKFALKANKVYINEKAASKGTDVDEPYQALFHEHGHQIDSLIKKQGIIAGTGNKKGDMISEVFKGKNGKTLSQTATSEIKEIIEERKAASPEFNTRNVKFMYIVELKQGYDLKTRGPLSDIMESTKQVGKYSLGIGHGKDYWDSSMKKNAEIFAGMMEARMANPKAYATIKKELPKTAAVFEELITEVSNGLK